MKNINSIRKKSKNTNKNKQKTTENFANIDDDITSGIDNTISAIGDVERVEYKEEDLYFVPPHRRRKMRVNDDRDLRVAKILAGSGPIAMFMITILDFVIDLVIDVMMLLSKILFDGFDYAYSGLLGNYQGIFPGYGGYSEYEESGVTYVEKYGSCFSYKFLRYFLTLITPPVGVFMGKGIRGWFSILLCVLLCYINYFLGMIYAFVITSRNRFADRYERRQAFVYGQNKKNNENSEKNSLVYIIAFGIMIGVMGGAFYFILKKM